MHKIFLGLSFLLLAEPCFAQEREWLLDAADEDVFLVFGVPNTTDVGVSFWCKISTGSLSLFAPSQATLIAPNSIALSIGTKTFDLPTAPSNDGDTKTVEAKLVPQDLILSELQAAERFSLTIGNHKSVYPLMDADFAGLLKLCSAKPQALGN